MRLPRRQFLHLAAYASALPAVSRAAMAQSYPTKPVRLIVGFAPGGPNDIHGRLIAQWLSERFGRPFIVENRPGASGNIGVESVVRSPADGHTILIVSNTDTINATLYDNLNFNFIRDIAPVAGMYRNGFILEVHPSLPARTVPELIAYARANPGSLNCASGGTGTPQHASSELFKMMTGINVLHVPYRGEGPALADMISGQVQVMFGGMTSSLQHVRAGRLRGLAVTTAARSPALPELPTVGEFVPAYESSGWIGVGAPKSTPTEVIDILNREINAGLSSPAIKERYADLGGTALYGSPAEFGRLIAEETEKWAKVVKYAAMKPG
jgi:tripartite-type tricarboxylate transporter receptor subunit TctC